jgi:DHA2 family methylenomycin A resistance protein-like MFS transporter
MSTGARGAAWKIVGVCSIAAFVVQLDGSALNVALPQIGRSFGVPLAVLQWVVDAYWLLHACLLLSTGAASDRFGPRRVLICGYGLFAAASVICALSPTPEMLIAGRALQGIGGSILVPSSLSLINHACGDDHGLRTRAIGLWTASGGVAISAGPVIGGLFVSSLGWRSIFLVNIPICLSGMWLALSYAERVARSAPRGFDWAGQILAIISLVGLVAGIIEGGSRGWNPQVVLLGMAIFVVFGAMFLRVEQRSPSPVLPLGLFRDRVFSCISGVGFVLSFCTVGLVFALSIYFQNVLGYSPVEAGLAFVPFSLMVTVSNLIGSNTAARVGSRPAIMAALALAAIGFVLMTAMDAASTYVQILPAQLLGRGGIGAAIPLTTSILLSAAVKSESGLASGVLNAVRQTAAAVGVAVFGALMIGDNVSGLRVGVMVCAALLALAVGAAAVSVRESRMHSRAR